MPGFELNLETAPVVAGICRRLDGLPLAIELAAARVRTLPLAEIAVRLEDRFRLLTGGDRAAVPRHRTLRATVEWSYGLLADRERPLFDRLSVFSGGWSLEAAEEVGSGDGIDTNEVLDLLTRLVDQSMVEVASGGGRFRMLETLRDYARARLEESGQAAVLRRRHLAYYTALADRADPRVPGSEQWKWYRGLEADADNLRAAMRWALDNGDTDSALGLGACLGLYWFLGNQQEGRRWLSQLLEAAPPARTSDGARALVAYGLVQAFHRTDEAGRAGREALSIYEQLGDQWAGAMARLLIVLDLLECGAASEATRLLDQAEAAFRAADDRRGEAIIWWLRSAVGLHAGDVALAVDAGKRSLERFRTLGDPWAWPACWEIWPSWHSGAGTIARPSRWVSNRWPWLARVDWLMPSRTTWSASRRCCCCSASRIAPKPVSRRAWPWQTASAIASARPWPTTGWACWPGNATTWTWPPHYHLAAVVIFREASGRAGMGGLAGLAQSLCCLARCHQLSRKLEEAERCHQQALSAAKEHGAPLPIAFCIEGQAAPAAAAGDAERAARLLGAAAAIRDRIGAPPLEPEHADVQQAAATACAVLGGEAFARAHQHGRTLDLNQLLDQLTV